MPVRKKGKGRVISIDMSGVESGGKAVPDGVYQVEVAEITEEESSTGNPYLKFKFKITDGASKGAALYDNLSLQPQALWKLKGLLEVMGQEVPDSSLDLELDDLIGGTLAVTVANEEYQGKERPKVASYGGEVSEDEPPASKKGGKKAAPKEEEEEDDDDDGDKPKFKVGQKVTFEDNKKKLKGKIVSLDDDTATVQTPDNEDWEISTDDLTAA